MVPPMQPPRKKRRTGLIIGIVVGAIAILVGVVLVIAFVVVAGDTGKAKDLINKAAPVINDAQPTLEKIGTQLEDMFTTIGNVTTEAEFAEIADPIIENLDKVKLDMEKAKGYLEDVKDLNSVEDYKEYADLALQVANAELELCDEVATYLNYVDEAFKAQDAGQPIDETEIASTTSEFVQTVQDLNAKANDYAEKAKKFKEDNDL